MSESGYRESSRVPEAGPGVLGSIERLLELEGRPIAPANAAALAQVRTAFDPKASPVAGGELGPLGFRFVGVCSEAIGDVPANDFDVWLREDATAYAFVRRSDLAILADEYRIRSFLTDGTFHETRARPPHVDLGHDVEVHDREVRAKVTEEVRIIPVMGPDEVVRLERFLVTHALDPERAKRLAGIRPFQRSVLAAAVVGGGLFALVMYLSPPRRRPEPVPAPQPSRAWSEMPASGPIVDGGGDGGGD